MKKLKWLGIFTFIVNTLLFSKVIEIKDAHQKLLLRAQSDAFFTDLSQGVLDINLSFRPKPLGMDILYRIYNPASKPKRLPLLEIPGIQFFDRGYLDILSTNTKLYMQTRALHQITHPKEKNPFYSIGSLIFRTFDGRYKEQEYYYGLDTFGPYAPVIVARDTYFSAGSALLYPFFSYRQKEAKAFGIHKVRKDKLYVRMRLYKKEDGFCYRYEFAHNRYQKALIYPKERIDFTLSLRFDTPKNYLQTLSPYKAFLEKTYPSRRVSKRDTRPVLGVIFAYSGNVRAKNERGWSWNFEKISKEGVSYLDLKELLQGLGLKMQEMGYERLMIWTLSGVYDGKRDPYMYDELPYQILTNLLPQMQQDLNGSVAYLKRLGHEVMLWWGISSMMPVDRAGRVLSPDIWQPYNDIPFRLEDPKHIAYAMRQLEMAKGLGIDGLGLDAYTRMEERSAFLWLKRLHAKLPFTALIAELGMDIYHKEAAIFLQPEHRLFEGVDLRYNMLTKPPELANYLNPNAPVYLFLQHSVAKSREREYVKRLCTMGYTPIVMVRPVGFDHREQNITKRILQNDKAFVDLKTH